MALQALFVVRLRLGLGVRTMDAIHSGGQSVEEVPKPGLVDCRPSVCAVSFYRLCGSFLEFWAVAEVGESSQS